MKDQRLSIRVLNTEVWFSNAYGYYFCFNMIPRLLTTQLTVKKRLNFLSDLNLWAKIQLYICLVMLEIINDKGDVNSIDICKND